MMFKGFRAWAPAVTAVLSVLAAATPVGAQVVPDDATRNMAMGDSIAAGFKAQPATNGYALLPTHA